MKLSFYKKQDFQSWDGSPQVLDYQDFLIIRCQIKGIVLYLGITFPSTAVFPLLIPYGLLWYTMELIVISHSVYLLPGCVLILNYFFYGENTKVQSHISHSSTITMSINICSPLCFHLVELHNFSVFKNVNFTFMQKWWDRLCFVQINFLIQAFMP